MTPLRALRIVSAMAIGLTTTPLAAAPGAWVSGVQPIATPAGVAGVPLPVSNPRKPAGPEAWAQQTPDQRLVYNVNAPGLIPYAGTLPATTTAPAVILVPGGGFTFLAMDNEGYDVARRLDRMGVRVFILKYRTAPVSGQFAGFVAVLTRIFVKGEPLPQPDPALPDAVADTQAAIRTVRANAAQWHVDAARLGIVGFSAGAITVLAATQAHVPDARADFVGMIYGPTAHAAVPPQAPPLFAALAADDRFFGGQDLGLIEDWRKSGASVELHLFSGGGHGFASHPNGTTSDGWFDEFALWLRARGVIAR